MGKELTELTKVNWHTMNANQAIQYLQTRFEGLTDKEVNERLAIYGFNQLKEERRISKATIFTRQIKEPLIIILLIAITISAFVGGLVDAIIISAIIILSTVMGFIQEFKSEKAIEALKKMTDCDMSGYPK